MKLICLKAIKPDNKMRKVCSNCNHVQLLGTLTACIAAVFHDESLLIAHWYSTGNRDRKCALAWRCWDTSYTLTVEQTRAAGWICLDPGLTNLAPSKTQANFLVDNKSFLLQQAAQLWKHCESMSAKDFRMSYRKKTTLNHSRFLWHVLASFNSLLKCQPDKVSN